MPRSAVMLWDIASESVLAAVKEGGMERYRASLMISMITSVSLCLRGEESGLEDRSRLVWTP